MKCISISLAFLFCLCPAFASEETKYCPALSDTSPCFCRHGFLYDVTGTRVSCSNINDTEVLYNEIQKFRGYPIDLLVLTQLNLPYLPAGLFMNTSVKRMVIRMSVLYNLYPVHESSPSPFHGLEDSLEELTIMTTQDPSKWYWTPLKNLKKLKRIELGESSLNFVGHVFAEIGGGSLESIIVQYSDVYHVHPQAFPSLTNLKEVSFLGNHLHYMVRTMFPDPAPQLKTIYLRDNLLFNLPENMFSNMPALTFLDLSRNKFLTLEEVVFTPIWNSMTDFYISDNPVKCDCNLSWLYKKMTTGEVPQYNDLEFLTCKSQESKKIPLKQAETALKCL